MRSARAAYKRHEIDKLLGSLEKTNNKDQQAGILSEIAARYRDLGDINNGLYYFIKSLHYKSDAKTHITIGELYEEARKHSDAIASYQRSLKLNPNQPLLYLRIARIFIQLHRENSAKDYLAQAEQWVTNAERLDRTDSAIAELRSDISQAKGDLGKALSIADNALQKYPDNVNLHFKYLELLEAEGKIDSAIVHAKRASSMVKDQASWWIYLNLYTERIHTRVNSQTHTKQQGDVYENGHSALAKDVVLFRIFVADNYSRLCIQRVDLFDNTDCIESCKLLKRLVQEGNEMIGSYVPKVTGGTVLNDDALLLEEYASRVTAHLGAFYYRRFLASQQYAHASKAASHFAKSFERFNYTMPNSINNDTLKQLRPAHTLAIMRLSETAKMAYSLAVELPSSEGKRLFPDIETHKREMRSIAMTCDRVLVAKEAGNLDGIVQILSFYWRHRVRRAIEKLLDILFIDKTFGWLPATDAASSQAFTIADVHEFLIKLCDAYELSRKQLVAPRGNISSATQQRFWKSLLYFQQYCADQTATLDRKEPLQFFIDKPRDVFSARQIQNYITTLRYVSLDKSEDAKQSSKPEEPELGAAGPVFASPPPTPDSFAIPTTPLPQSPAVVDVKPSLASPNKVPSRLARLHELRAQCRQMLHDDGRASSVLATKEQKRTKVEMDKPEGKYSAPDQRSPSSVKKAIVHQPDAAASFPPGSNGEVKQVKPTSFHEPAVFFVPTTPEASFNPIQPGSSVSGSMSSAADFTSSASASLPAADANYAPLGIPKSGAKLEKEKKSDSENKPTALGFSLAEVVKAPSSGWKCACCESDNSESESTCSTCLVPRPSSTSVASTPAMKSDSKIDSKSTFTFGPTSLPASESHFASPSTFSFGTNIGSAPNVDKPNEPATVSEPANKPALSFGSMPGSAALSFGFTAPSASDKAEPKGFSFGGVPGGEDVSFGTSGAAAQTAVTPALSFGVTPANSSSASNFSAESIGSAFSGFGSQLGSAKVDEQSTGTFIFAPTTGSAPFTAPAAEKAAAPKNGWQCACCETQNTEADTTCTVCMVPRPAPTPSVETPPETDSETASADSTATANSGQSTFSFGASAPSAGFSFGSSFGTIASSGSALSFGATMGSGGFSFGQGSAIGSKPTNGWKCACCETDNSESDTTCTVCLVPRPVKQQAAVVQVPPPGEIQEQPNVVADSDTERLPDTAGPSTPSLEDSTARLSDNVQPNIDTTVSAFKFGDTSESTKEMKAPGSISTEPIGIAKVTPTTSIPFSFGGFSEALETTTEDTNENVGKSVEPSPKPSISQAETSEASQSALLQSSGASSLAAQSTVSPAPSAKAPNPFSFASGPTSFMSSSGVSFSTFAPTSGSLSLSVADAPPSFDNARRLNDEEEDEEEEDSDVTSGSDSDEEATIVPPTKQTSSSATGTPAAATFSFTPSSFSVPSTTESIFSGSSNFGSTSALSIPAPTASFGVGFGQTSPLGMKPANDYDKSTKTGLGGGSGFDFSSSSSFATKPALSFSSIAGDAADSKSNTEVSATPFQSFSFSSGSFLSLASTTSSTSSSTNSSTASFSSPLAGSASASTTPAFGTSSLFAPSSTLSNSEDKQVQGNTDASVSTSGSAHVSSQSLTISSSVAENEKPPTSTFSFSLSNSASSVPSSASSSQPPTISSSAPESEKPSTSTLSFSLPNSASFVPSSASSTFAFVTPESVSATRESTSDNPKLSAYTPMSFTSGLQSFSEKTSILPPDTPESNLAADATSQSVSESDNDLKGRTADEHNNEEGNHYDTDGEDNDDDKEEGDEYDDEDEDEDEDDVDDEDQDDDDDDDEDEEEEDEEEEEEGPSRFRERSGSAKLSRTSRAFSSRFTADESDEDDAPTPSSSSAASSFTFSTPFVPPTSSSTVPASSFTSSFASSFDPPSSSFGSPFPTFSTSSSQPSLADSSSSFSTFSPALGSSGSFSFASPATPDSSAAASTFSLGSASPAPGSGRRVIAARRRGR